MMHSVRYAQRILSLVCPAAGLIFCSKNSEGYIPEPAFRQITIEIDVRLG